MGCDRVLLNLHEISPTDFGLAVVGRAAMKMAIGLVLAWAAPAQAHDWYDPNCCGGADCHALSSSAVKELPDGWLTPMGWVGYRDARVLPSQDERYHICTSHLPAVVSCGDSKSTAPQFLYMRCLYVPPRGM